MKNWLKDISKVLPRALPFLALIIFVGIFILVPIDQVQAAQAGDWWTSTLDKVKWGLNFAKDPIGYIENIIPAILYFIFSLALKFFNYFTNFAAWAVNIFLNPTIYHEVLGTSATPSPAIDQGWLVCRDLSNLFFVMLLLAIAFATIFRIQAYSAKALLPKFIFAIFLINFSKVIATIVIDFGQILMFEFVDWMGGTFGPSGSDEGALSSLTAIPHGFVQQYSVGFKVSYDDVGGAFFAAIFTLVLALVYLILAGFLLVRLIMLGLLIVLSPFAFIAVILPSTRSYSSKWWSNLFKYVLFGPIFVFFIYLAGEMGRHLMDVGTPPTYPGITAPELFTNSALGESPSIFDSVIIYFVKGGIVMGMLLTSVFMTRSMGIAGASAIIGGTAGIGLMAGKVYRGARYGAGKAKGAVSAPLSRAHAALKGKSEWYKDKSEGISKTLKHSPIGGRMVIKMEAEKAEKLKEEVSKHEKVMSNLTDKDKKAYVDSFKVDMKAKAAAQQAMFNLLAKDNGKGLTDDRLRKAGYKKDIVDANGKVIGEEFDKEGFNKDVGRAMAHGFNTTNIETYRPDVIKDENNKLDRVAKIVADGDEKKIKLNALSDPAIADKLLELIGKKKYDKLINDKSQEEKDGLIRNKETKIAQEISSGTLTVGSDELRKRQEEIALLAGADRKIEKMKNIDGVNPDGSLHYEPNVNIEIANNVVNKMPKDQFLDLDPKEFFEKYGHLISESNITHISKFGETEQLKAMKKALDKATSPTPTVAIPAGLDPAKLVARKNKVNKQL